MVVGCIVVALCGSMDCLCVVVAWFSVCPKRGGPAVWDHVCKLMVPCSSRGGYHVGGGGDFHGLHCAHTLALLGC